MEFQQKISPIEERLSSKFPGLIPGDMRRLIRLARDPQSLLHGEIERWRMLLRQLDEVALEAARQGYPQHVRKRMLQRALHDFFVGELGMYAGTPDDFENNYRQWRNACRDVEELNSYLLGYLPKEMHTGLRLPEEVAEERNPIRLIELVRSGGFGRDPWVRHCARLKLVLGQTFFEYRRNGFAPEYLEERAYQLRKRLERRLFKRHSKKRMRLVATLDPDDANRCISYEIVDNPSVRIAESERTWVMDIDQYVIVNKRGEETRVLFSIRPKRFAVLKGMIKDIRFVQLANIGDGVAMMFIVESESDLDKVVDKVRSVLVRAPGSVCDQNSNLGHRAGRKLDNGNSHSSDAFQVMKYNALVQDLVVEVQFTPVVTLVDNKCRTDRAHADYKARQYCESVMEPFFPSYLTGIHWPSDFRLKDGEYVPRHHPETWAKIKAHIRQRHVQQKL